MNPDWCFSSAARTVQELLNPVHYLTALIFASPLDTPSPATYLRDALHGFSMNTLLVRDFEGLAQNLILTPLLWFRNRQRADNGRYVGLIPVRGR